MWKSAGDFERDSQAYDAAADDDNVVARVSHAVLVAKCGHGRSVAYIVSRKAFFANNRRWCDQPASNIPDQYLNPTILVDDESHDGTLAGIGGRSGRRSGHGNLINHGLVPCRPGCTRTITDSAAGKQSERQ